MLDDGKYLPIDCPIKPLPNGTYVDTMGRVFAIAREAARDRQRRDWQEKQAHLSPVRKRQLRRRPAQPSGFIFSGVLPPKPRKPGRPRPGKKLSCVERAANRRALAKAGDRAEAMMRFVEAPTEELLPNVMLDLGEFREAPARGAQLRVSSSSGGRKASTQRRALSATRSRCPFLRAKASFVMVCERNCRIASGVTSWSARRSAAMARWTFNSVSRCVTRCSSACKSVSATAPFSTLFLKAKACRESLFLRKGER